MRTSIFIFCFFIASNLKGQTKILETSVDYFVDSLIKIGIDSVLTIEIGTEGSSAASVENKQSIYVLWSEKNNYFIKKWLPNKQYKEEQVFGIHLYNYIKLNYPRLKNEKFKSCVLSDHFKFTVIRIRTKEGLHHFKKYSYEFSDSCPDEMEYNNHLLLKRMFDLFESEINYINSKMDWEVLRLQ